MTFPGATAPDLSGETRITWQEHLIFGADRVADRLWYTPPQPLFASAVHALAVAGIVVLLLVIVYRLAAYSPAAPQIDMAELRAAPQPSPVETEGRAAA